MKRFLRWRVPAGCLLPSVHQELSRALELLLVRPHSPSARRAHSRLSPQAPGERPARWQVKCRVCHHAAPQAGAGPAKDAFLVSLDAGDASAPGYVVLRADKQVLEAEACIFEARPGSRARAVVALSTSSPDI